MQDFWDQPSVCMHTCISAEKNSSVPPCCPKGDLALGAWPPHTIPQAGRQCGRKKFQICPGKWETCSKRVKDTVVPNTQSMRCRQEHISWGGAAGWHFGTGWAGAHVTHKDSTSPRCLAGIGKVDIIERYMSTLTQLFSFFSFCQTAVMYSWKALVWKQIETNWAQHRSITSGLKKHPPAAGHKLFSWERKHSLVEEGEVTAVLSSWRWKGKVVLEGGSPCLQEIKQEGTDLN